MSVRRGWGAATRGVQRRADGRDGEHFDHDHDHVHDHVAGAWRWWRAWRGVVLVVAMGALGTACTSAPMCVPDGAVACCTPGDNQLCTADGGVSGLRACGMSGFWSDCVGFMDAGPEDHQTFQDTGGLPDFGRVDH